MTIARDLANIFSSANLANGFVKLDGSSVLPAISGASLTSLPAGNLTGTVADARISSLTSSKLTGALPALDGASLTGIVAINVGTILSWTNASVPSGFLECNGSAISRTTY